jgi:hypothetical protein
MSDYIEVSIKNCKKEELVSLIKNTDGLLSSKVNQSGISIREDLLYASKKEAMSCLIVESLTGKHSPALAVRYLIKEPSLLRVDSKIEKLKKELSDINLIIGCDDGFGSLFIAIRDRVVKEKSKSKSCSGCGVSHDTTSSRTLSFVFCGKCHLKTYLFTKSDLLKLKNLQDKSVVISNKIIIEEENRNKKIKKSFTLKNWYWYVGAGTKTLSAEDDYY